MIRERRIAVPVQRKYRRVGQGGNDRRAVDRLFDIFRLANKATRNTAEESVKRLPSKIIQGLHALLIPVVQALVAGLFDEARSRTSGLTDRHSFTGFKDALNVRRSWVESIAA